MFGEAFFFVDSIRLLCYNNIVGVDDAWGNFTISYNANQIAANNPFTYRGYYYDGEYGFYCLGTRFYDPAVGRFINADTSAVITATPTALTDKNLYAYCDNTLLCAPMPTVSFGMCLSGR